MSRAEAGRPRARCQRRRCAGSSDPCPDCGIFTQTSVVQDWKRSRSARDALASPTAGSVAASEPSNARASAEGLPALPHLRAQGGRRLIQLSTYGDPAKMAARIIASADLEPAPLRLVLGSDAHRFLTAALSSRLAEVQAQAATAPATDWTDHLLAQTSNKHAPERLRLTFPRQATRSAGGDKKPSLTMRIWAWPMPARLP